MISETSLDDANQKSARTGKKNQASDATLAPVQPKSKKEKEDNSLFITKDEFMAIQFDYQWPKII